MYCCSVTNPVVMVSHSLSDVGDLQFSKTFNQDWEEVGAKGSGSTGSGVRHYH